jgi:hypothetical protein
MLFNRDDRVNRLGEISHFGLLFKCPATLGKNMVWCRYFKTLEVGDVDVLDFQIEL